VGTDNEGIHTISVDDNHKILLFESQEDAATFARQLGEQNFPVPSVEAMKAEEILLFCKKSVYDWEFVPKGANRTPPVDNKDIDQEDTAQQKRTQAYLNLINQLLTCNQGDEPRILQENEELLDQGLIEVMVAVAQQYGEAGRENEARWLMNMAQQLAEALGFVPEGTNRIPPSQNQTMNQQDYFNFLMEVLQKVADNPNPDLIYPFLSQNLDKLDENLIMVLENWSKQILANITTQQAYSLGKDIVNFSNIILGFSGGNIATNKEIVIAGYKIALNAFNFNIYPQNWAMTQSNLATVYLDRIKDDKAENLEKAIKAYIEALKGFSFEKFPQDWASINNALGRAYSNRIRGNKVENLEMAIAAYTNALKVFTFDRFPYKWANINNQLGNLYYYRTKGIKKDNLEISIFCFQSYLKVYTSDSLSSEYAQGQFNLGEAYLKRIKGDKAENIENAITCYRESLKIYNRDKFPAKWSTVQTSLGIAYYEKIKGKKSDNLETAIDYFKLSLQIRTCDTFPIDWAGTKHNLAAVYLDRIKGNKQQNLEDAITHCKDALRVFTFDDFPEDWARIQNNLAIAYSKRIQGDKADNLEKAIIYCHEALKVYKLDNYPLDWARTKNNLATVYRNRIRENKAENIEKAITHCEEALRIVTFDLFPLDWATTQNNLAVSYSTRIRENKAENVEKSITHCEEALRVFTFDAFPQDWAGIQNNLGMAYGERIEGDRADNLEKAIVAYTEALKVHTFNDFPYDWARIQNNLAMAYRQRIRENKADNLEIAINYSQEALKVLTLEAFPQNWAIIQRTLGNIYSDRIRGDKAENLEKAIVYYQEALKVLMFNTFPQDWAMAQNNLGIAYPNRIRGDKAENLERAITCYQEALKVFTFEVFPEDWAMVKHNLAVAYDERIRGNKSDNLEIAIDYYKEALKVRTFNSFPEDWAATQNSLGITYSDRIRGDKAENLEQAITAYIEALKVRTFGAFPHDWADTQSNLGNAYCQRVRGNKDENLEKAITCYQESLRVRTFDAFPLNWATTQNNLANAYSYKIGGDKAQNLQQAITYYHNALKIRTKEADPLNCLQTARNLAKLYYDQKQWQPAAKAYHIAIEAVENARLEALNPQSRQEVLSNEIDVFDRIVQAHLNLNQPEKALEYIERSKGRNLVELMTQKNLQPQGVSQEIIDQLNELKQRVVNEQIRLQHQRIDQNLLDELKQRVVNELISLQQQSINQNLMRWDNLTPYVQDHSYLKEYQQDLDNFIAREIKDPLFSLTQKVEPIPFTEIQALTDAETCLLQWYITVEKILAFVVSADGEIKVWQSSENDKNQFLDTFNNYRQLYYSKNGKKEWINQLPNLLQTFADTLHINDIIALIPNTCKRLIIIPHYFLHILPIHAFPINENQILQDKYDVQYAPSCQLLQITKQRQLNELTNLFAIQNPTKDLFYTDLEVTILSTFFTEPQVIAKDNATKNAVLPHLKSSDNHCYHFSCHGGFNPDNPLESALFLANKEPLTLGEIFELRLNKCRLVTLSACETGLIDLNSISDEYIGLPSGFLFAGSPSVVSSLWKVNDLQTSFLMIKFYEILFDENQQVSVPVALKQAQYWLQNLTVQEYLNQLNSCQEIVKLMQQKLTTEEFKRLIDMIEDEQIRIKGFELNYKLFNNPFYWAAFTAAGI
jgi:CHAT domain-containing protein